MAQGRVQCLTLLNTVMNFRFLKDAHVLEQLKHCTTFRWGGGAKNRVDYLVVSWEL